MDVTLTPELERLIHDKVASGLYTSEDEVLREALRLLKDRDELRILAVEDFRWEVQKGLDQLDRGESVLLDRAYQNRRAASAGRLTNRSPKSLTTCLPGTPSQS